MNHEIDPDLARILRAWLDTVRVPQRPIGRGNKAFNESVRLMLPVELLQRLRKKCRRDENNRAIDLSRHVERAITAYLDIMEMNPEKPSTK